MDEPLPTPHRVAGQIRAWEVKGHCGAVDFWLGQNVVVKDCPLQELRQRLAGDGSGELRSICVHCALGSLIPWPFFPQPLYCPASSCLDHTGALSTTTCPYNFFLTPLKFILISPYSFSGPLLKQLYLPYVLPMEDGLFPCRPKSPAFPSHLQPHIPP